MNHEKYPLQTDSKSLIFEFKSKGTKGIVRKIIQYSPTRIDGVYNLGFGDFDEITGELNDFTVTNNGDTNKVLATVASTVSLFFEKHPNSSVYVEGSTPVRTRLYRIGITNNLLEIRSNFEIYGLVINEWEKFDPKKDYVAFLIRKKKL
jgi:hypothetical protein